MHPKQNAIFKRCTAHKTRNEGKMHAKGKIILVSFFLLIAIFLSVGIASLQRGGSTITGNVVAVDDTREIDALKGCAPQFVDEWRCSAKGRDRVFITADCSKDWLPYDCPDGLECYGAGFCRPRVH